MSLAFDQSDEVKRLRAELAEVKGVLQETRMRCNIELDLKRQYEAKYALAMDILRATPNVLESRVRSWVESRIGVEHMQPKERAMRLLEEAVELVQAEGIDIDLAAKQVAHVYERPAGEPSQEAAGVAVCLLGWCASRGLRFEEIALAEIERIEAKSIEDIKASLARKGAAELVTTEAK